uniref:Uncharacterized protein n=1 Tax=Anopheles quadriannulatus TaxID=34691 RepID=A0A182XPM9_ANOQN
MMMMLNYLMMKNHFKMKIVKTKSILISNILRLKI